MVIMICMLQLLTASTYITKKQLPKGYAAEKSVQSITGRASDLGRRDLR